LKFKYHNRWSCVAIENRGMEKHKHKRLLREIGFLGEVPPEVNEGEGDQARRSKRGRRDVEPPESEEEMEEERDRGKWKVRRGERKSERRKVQPEVVELVDTEDEQDVEEEEEEAEDSPEEDEISEPKPPNRVLKKSWKTAESEPKQQRNEFERFGFVGTKKTSMIPQMAAMPKASSKRKGKKVDSEDEFESDETPPKTSKKGQKLRVRSASESLSNIRSAKQTALRVRSKSERGSSKVVSYAEESEESEATILSSEEEEKPKPKLKRRPSKTESKKDRKSSKEKNSSAKNGKTQKQKSKKKSSESEDDQMIQSEEEDAAVAEAEEGDGEDSEEFQYRIEHILGSKKLTAEEWRNLCEKMTTREITRGSVLQQPPEEYFSTSPELVEKFLIKWAHCSYLHVSWETRSDLESLVGSTARTHLNRYFLSQVRGVSTFFDDLRPDEYFPPTVLNIDRVLDADDDTIDIQTVDWENAILPRNPYLPTSSDSPCPVEENDDDSVTYLHSEKCFLTVKWENLPYCDCTFEDINDLRRMSVEYESCLRDYYRREQLPPAKNSRRVIKRKIDPEVMQTPPSFKVGELRDYQWDGVRWMLYNWSNKRNSILADEMGLGKTIQTAAFLQILNQYQGLRGPFLIVAPLSTLVNWQREMSAWTTLDSIVYHGSLEDRKLIREHEIYYMTRPKSDGYKVQIVITSPEGCLATDGSNIKTRLLSQIHWDVLIIDEAHRIKNHASKISTSLRQDFSYSNCVLLTGTPLQNNTEELWTLLHFIEPVKFESKDSFVAQFGELKESSQLEQLHQRISPYLLRRIKENVEKSVPPKEEILIEVELTVPQKQYYRALYEGNKAFLFRGALKDGPKLTNLAMELRKCCNHPYLVRGAESELKHHFSEQGKDANSSSSSSPPTPQQELLHALIQSSGKLVLLDKLLPKLAADGHRVLIFSQFRIMLDILEDYLALRKFSYDRIDGGITGRKRQAAIDRFCQPDSSLFIMLLSTRAGGVGINLTPADTVIIYDSDWNPQNDIQAQARAHRIGQTKTVKVYRLLTKKSYEMRMFEVASRKLGLDYAVMHNLKASHSSQSKTNAPTTVSFTSKELESLLRQGAYDIFREEKDGSGDLESKKFCEEDIDQILSRSTVIIHDDAQKKQLPNANFSKASFVQTGSQCNVDVNDPDFWSKVVGLTLVEEVEENTRRRKCKSAVTNYLEEKVNGGSDNDSDFAEDSSTSEKPKRGPKAKLKKDANPSRDMNTLVPASWNLTNLNTLSLALFSCGYLNWERIKNASRLPFSLEDIASGCRMLVLYYIRVTCLVDASQIASNSDLDSLLVALSKFNQSTFCRFVMLSYRRELHRKSHPSEPTNNTLSIEDELLLGFYQNPSPNKFDHYVASKHSEWTNEPTFHYMHQLLTSVPLPSEYSKVSVIVQDSKLRNAIKSKLGTLETHFEIAHALRLNQLHAREKLLIPVSIGNEKYPGFDPFASSLEEYLMDNLLVEDSPAEWWVTGADDLLLMAGVSELGFPSHQSGVTSLEDFITKQDPGPLHRKPLNSCEDEFLVGGSGYSATPTTTLERLEKGSLQHRILDIAGVLR
jgi:superfamily II DNA or RNA helicase